MNTINYLLVPEVKLSYRDENMSKRIRINLSYDAVELLKNVFNDFMQHHEECWILLLSQGNRVLGLHKVAQGSLDQTLVDIRSIMQSVILSNAAAIIVCHNHPSGELKPSVYDTAITKKMQEACKIFGISLLDHIIIADEGYYSFTDEGLL